MKRNAIVRIVLFSAAIVVLAGILLSELLIRLLTVDSVSTNKQTYVDTGKVIQQESITPNIQNIEIEWVAGSIKLEKDPDATDISVVEYAPTNSEHPMVVKQSGQTLKIQYSEQEIKVQFPSFGINVDYSKDLVITVPENWTCGTLEIDTASAEIELDGFTIDEFDFDGASGECVITNCDIRELDIDTASGNVYFSGTLNTLDFDAASADCTIEVTNVPRSLKLDAMSGDLELVLPPDAGFSCSLDSMSSSFDTDFEFKMKNDEYICGDGACKIKLSAMSGAVSILKGIE